MALTSRPPRERAAACPGRVGQGRRDREAALGDDLEGAVDGDLHDAAGAVDPGVGRQGGLLFLRELHHVGRRVGLERGPGTGTGLVRLGDRKGRRVAGDRPRLEDLAEGDHRREGEGDEERETRDGSEDPLDVDLGVELRRLVLRAVVVSHGRAPP